MKSLIQRLFFKNVSTKPEGAQKVEARPDQTVSVNQASTTSNTAVIAQNTLIGIGARRPVIAETGDVVGYEFSIPGTAIERLKNSTDKRANAAYIACVTTSALLAVNVGKIGFARIPAYLLDQGMTLHDCAGIWVSIEHIPTLNAGDVKTNTDWNAFAQFVQRLKAVGAKVGWEPHLLEYAKLNLELAPDFVLLRQGEASIAALVEVRQNLPEPFKALPTFATDLRSEEELESALLGSISYVCGAFSLSKSLPDTPMRPPVPPDVIRLVSLMNLLNSDAELSTVVADIKGDVGLSYRLLSLMRSAKYANRQTSLNIEQAVLTLGRDELYRVLSVLLLRYTGTRRVSSALEEIALWRSRFLELLANARHEPMPGNFFTLGLVSMLGSILKQDLADVVQKIAIPEPAKNALLQEDGPWYTYLKIALEIEAHKLSDNSLLTTEFGGQQRVLELSDRAWDWAAEQSRRN